MPTKYTTEYFIQRAIKVHGDKYNYNKTNYVNSLTKVIIVCPKHGQFMQNPTIHINKHGCPNCSSHKKLTTKEFIQKAQYAHGNKYDYSKVNYKGIFNKITIICPIHGEFLQRPNNHINKKQGCAKCSPENEKWKEKYNNKNFIKRAIKIHGNKYCYNKIIYKNAHTPIIIICKIHGNFQQMPYSHLNGNGCQKCSKEKSSYNQRMRLENFTKKSIKIHNNKYNYKNTIYGKNNADKVSINCPAHGVFLQTPNNHLNGMGCPKCSGNISKLESLWLNKIKIPNDKNHRQVYLKINEKRFKVDGYISKTKTIYEFLGDYYHGNPKKFKANEYNQTCHKTFGKLYKLTLKRINTFKKNGYKVKYIWENDFKKQPNKFVKS